MENKLSLLRITWTNRVDYETIRIGNESVPIQLAQCWFSGLAISNAKYHPHKRRHSRWKLSQELKVKQAAFFAKYTCVEMASRKIKTYQKKAKNLCTIYFVCLFVCLSIRPSVAHDHESCKTAEAIEMPFGAWDQGASY